MKTITGDDIQEMVRHWLETPVNGYLGSSYGSDTNSLLQRAISEPEQTDQYLKKLRTDVEILAALPADSVAMYGTIEGADKMRITIEVAGRSYDLGSEGGGR